MTTLALQGTTDTFAPQNAFGRAFGSVALPEVNDSLTAAIAEGTLSILLDAPSLSDLTGQTAPTLTLGVLRSSPIREIGNPATYSGNSDLDWWYRPEPADLDAQGNPFDQVAGSIAAGALSVGPERLSLALVLGGASALLDMSNVHLAATIGASSSPLASGNGFAPGHLPSEELAPALTSFQTMTNGRLRGNVTAASLASIPIPATVLQQCPQYTQANSLLDLLVGGCTFAGIITVVSRTQPDQVDPDAPGAASGPFLLSADAGRRVTTCRDNASQVVALATCLEAAAYSAYFRFTTRRVVMTQGAYSVTAQVVGGSGGTLTGYGISCPGDCAERFMHGASTALTATANPGFAISSWNGCDSVQGDVCTVAVNGARAVSVTFGAALTTPGAPTGLGALAAVGAATISFSAPGSDGGSAITSYTASCLPGPISNSAPGSPITVGGLTNGQAYSCTVTATNAVGTGPASVAIDVTPGSAPSITSGPPPGGTFGATYAHTFAALGAPAPTFAVTAGALPPGLSLSASGSVTGTPTAAGLHTGTVTASNGLTPVATQDFGITIAKAAQSITFGAPPSITAGGTGTVSASGGGSGNPVSFSSTTPSTCSITGATVSGLASGTCTIAANQAGNANYEAAPEATQSFSIGAPPSPPRLFNIATRGPVLTGDNVMIAGFIIGGSAPKSVLVRARGPSLSQFGVPGVLQNPQMHLYSGQTVIDSNDNWVDAANKTAIESTGLAPESPQESAILTTLAPGGYTAIVSGVGNTTGIGIVEVFEAGEATTGLHNIATRGQTQAGDNVMIAGFIIQGDGPQTVLIRARGPSLTQFGVPGVLANPKLDLYSGQTVIGSNDNWVDAPNKAAIEASGNAPGDPNEAAIFTTLQPGGYTAIVTGVGGGTGVAIVEVFRN